MSEFDLLDELQSDLFGAQFLEHLEKKKVIDAVDSQVLSDFERTFSSDHGRRVLINIMEVGKIGHTTFTGNSWGTFFEGIRSMSLYVIHMATRNKHLKQRDKLDLERMKAKKK
jgi:hypothetical protein